jgi:hypothetical protein
MLLLLLQMYWLWVDGRSRCSWYQEAGWVVLLWSSKMTAVCTVITLVITLAIVVVLLLVGVPGVAVSAVSVSVPVSAVPGVAAAATLRLSTPLLLPAMDIQGKDNNR